MHVCGRLAEDRLKDLAESKLTPGCIDLIQSPYNQQL
jgi:hypothetical protein